MPHEVIVPYRYPDTVEYREIPEEPSYRVGSDGTLWSRIKHSLNPKGEWRRLKLHAEKGGHLFTTLKISGRRKTYFAHSLVLEVFVCKKPHGMEACHGPYHDPAMNDLTNLRWDTRLENMRDKIAMGKGNEGEKNKLARHTDAQVIEMRKMLENGVRNREVCRIFEIDQSSLSKIKLRKTWRHI